MALARPNKKKTKPQQPFYESSKGKTSAEIVSEARKELKAVKSKRPETPSCTERHLFGNTSKAPLIGRPPSVYSLGRRHFNEGDLSRPSTGQKLSPLDRRLSTGSLERIPQESDSTPGTPSHSVSNPLSLLSRPLHSQGSPGTDRGSKPRPQRDAGKSSSRPGTNSSGGSDRSAPSRTEALQNGNDLNPNGDDVQQTQEGVGYVDKRMKSNTKSSKSDSSSHAHRQVFDKREASLQMCDSSLQEGSSLENGIGRETSTVGEESQGSNSTEPSSQDRSERDACHGGRKEGMEVKEQSKPLGRIVSADAVSGKSGSPEERAGLESSPSRHHSAGGPVSRSAGQSKRIGSSPKGKSSSYWDLHILPLLDQLQPSASDPQICGLLDVLWERLSTGGYLGRAGGGGGTKNRSAVRKSVFSLLDSKNPQVLLKGVKLLLAMKVTGHNLHSTCKLVFTISKDERNDAFFAREQILGILLSVVVDLDVLAQPEVAVYCYGAVRLLCSNTDLRSQVVAGEIVSALATVIGKLKMVPAGLSSLQASSILIQVVWALRNLSDDLCLLEQFISMDIISGLCAVLEEYRTDEELMFMISRLFSKLTTHSGCCTAIASCTDGLQSFCSLLELHITNPDIVLRVCFALGNMTTSADGPRLKLHRQCGLLSAVCAVFRRYLSKVEEAGDERTMREDVLIKLQRVLANLSISPEVGKEVAQNSECAKHLLKVIEMRTHWTSDEVVSNALATVNNLSYYSTPSGPWIQHCGALTALLLDLLLSDSKEGILDCLRVCGNLTCHQQACNILVQQKVGEVVVTLLDSENVEVVYAACGVLLNLVAVPELRTLLSDNSGVRKLIEVLGDFGQNDWQLSSLVCKTLWNFSDKITSSALCFGSEETDLLAEQLELYLDEEHVLESLPGDAPEDSRAFLYSLWKSDFCPVARPLLERVRQFHTDLVPL